MIPVMNVGDLKKFLEAYADDVHVMVEGSGHLLQVDDGIVTISGDPEEHQAVFLNGPGVD